MLSDHNKAVLDDLKGKRKVEFEVNFSSDPKWTDTVRVIMGSEEAYIPVRDLYGLIFVICNEEQQQDLMPVRQTTITKYLRQHTIRVGKSMKPGDTIVANCEIDVPTTVEEGISGILNKRKKSPILRA